MRKRLIDKQILKYPKYEYTGSGYYAPDRDAEYSVTEEKLVKCRKPHRCVSCQKEIPAGNYALKESALFPGEGWKSAYTCTTCIEGWLDEIHMVNDYKRRRFATYE